MTEPPLDFGAVKTMLALALPAVAALIVGAPGTVAGVTVLILEDALVLLEFVALTPQL